MKPDDKETIAKWVPLVFGVCVAVITPLAAWSRWSVNDKRVRWL